MIAGARLAGPQDRARRRTSPLLFVHGVGSTAAIWDYQLADFRNDSLCAAIELRGNGTQKPDPPPSQITRAGYADDVLTIADALEIERFTLVGCSLGGVVAFELWRRARQRIAAMVLVGAFACYPDGDRVAQSIAAQAREAGDMRAFGELRAAKLGLPPVRLNETIEQYACKSLECFVAATAATWTGDYRDDLSEHRRTGARRVRRAGCHRAACACSGNCVGRCRRRARDGFRGGPRCQRRRADVIQSARARVSAAQRLDLDDAFRRSVDVRAIVAHESGQRDVELAR